MWGNPSTNLQNRTASQERVPEAYKLLTCLACPCPWKVNLIVSVHSSQFSVQIIRSQLTVHTASARRTSPNGYSSVVLAQTDQGRDSSQTDQGRDSRTTLSPTLTPTDGAPLVPPPAPVSSSPPALPSCRPLSPLLAATSRCMLVLTTGAQRCFSPRHPKVTATCRRLPDPHVDDHHCVSIASATSCPSCT
jgi:hypothetical protein